MSAKMEQIEFVVPLPPAALSPNSRAHWREKLTAKRAYAEAVWIAGAQATLRQKYPWKWASVHLVKHSTHQTDQDNIIAACKTLIDQLSTTGTNPLAIFEDDKRISVTAEWKRERVRQHGRIEVTITRRFDP